MSWKSGLDKCTRGVCKVRTEGKVGALHVQVQVVPRPEAVPCRGKIKMIMCSSRTASVQLCSGSKILTCNHAAANHTTCNDDVMRVGAKTQTVVGHGVYTQAPPCVLRRFVCRVGNSNGGVGSSNGAGSSNG